MQKGGKAVTEGDAIPREWEEGSSPVSFPGRMKPPWWGAGRLQKAEEVGEVRQKR